MLLSLSPTDETDNDVCLTEDFAFLTELSGGVNTIFGTHWKFGTLGSMVGVFNSKLALETFSLAFSSETSGRPGTVTAGFIGDGLCLFGTVGGCMLTGILTGGVCGDDIYVITNKIKSFAGKSMLANRTYSIHPKFRMIRSSRRN